MKPELYNVGEAAISLHNNGKRGSFPMFGIKKKSISDMSGASSLSKFMPIAVKGEMRVLYLISLM